MVNSPLTTIGRSTKHHIVMKSEGVSRNHAEIIVEEKDIKIALRNDDSSSPVNHIAIGSSNGLNYQNA